MNWLFFALLAPAVYAATTFIDKYLITKEVKEYNAMSIYTALVGFIAGCVFWIVFRFPVLSTRDGLIVLTTGLLTSWSLVFYFKALSIEESSIINILFQTFPIVTLILSVIFLKEFINLKQFIGFLFVFSSSILISLKTVKKKFRLTQAFYLILLSNVLWAISGVLMKFALNVNSFSKILSYESWGVAIGGVMIYCLVGNIRNSFNKSLKEVNKRVFWVIFLNEATNIFAKSLTFFALSLGPVALVSVLENTQAFYAIFIGLILTLLFPSVFKENISKKGFGLKLGSLILLLIGVALIY